MISHLKTLEILPLYFHPYSLLTSSFTIGIYYINFFFFPFFNAGTIFRCHSIERIRICYLLLQIQQMSKIKVLFLRSFDRFMYGIFNCFIYSQGNDFSLNLKHLKKLSFFLSLCSLNKKKKKKRFALHFFLEQFKFLAPKRTGENFQIFTADIKKQTL